MRLLKSKHMKRLLLQVIFAFVALNAFSNSIRVEPASWWIGMKSPKVQIMLYEKDIATLTPEVTYDGVKISAVDFVTNRNYIFVTLTIDTKAKPGVFPIVLKSNAKKVKSVDFTLMDRKGVAQKRAGFSDRDVIYLITPDRFSNGDPANDNLPSLKEGVNRSNEDGRHGGDIKGIIDHVDYISDMGYTAIWLTPALENDQVDFSYHGYSITDFYKIDPRMGSNELYRELCSKAASKGVKVIMDMVFNHCGSEHWWLKDLPSKDWINFPDSVVFTNHRKSVIQDPHVSYSDSIQLTDGWFAKTMPDLNQRNELLATYLIQNTLWWIEFTGLSGIRVDTYPYPDMYFMSDWARRIQEEYPGFNIVGEEWSENPAIVSYWQRGKINKNGYESNLPSLMDFPVQATLIKALNEEEKYNSGGFLGLYEMIGNDFLYPSPDDLVVFADNHDIPRVHNQLNGDVGLLKLATTFLLTTRGIPQFLYGGEVLMSGISHGKIRSDFPGGWKGDAINAFIGKGLTPEQKEFQAYTKRILNWRKTSPLLENAKLIHYRPEKEVYVYFRQNDKGKVMVVLNKNNNESEITPDRYRETIGNSSSGHDIVADSRISFTATFKVPPRSALIIEIPN